MFFKMAIVFLLLAFIMLPLQASTFINYGQKINVVDRKLQLPDTSSITIELSQRLIVKSLLNTVPTSIVNDKAIVSYQLIFQAEAFTLYLLTLSPNVDITAYAKKISQHQKIVYAQPDIRQSTRIFTQSDERFNDNKKNNKKNNEKFNYKNKDYQISNVKYLSDSTALSTGKGVKLAVIDNGFLLSHQEFQQVNELFTYDVDSGSYNVSPQNIKRDNHGTRVMGLIWANDKLQGMAPEAQLIAVRLSSTWTSDIIKAFTVAYQAGADIINCSWVLPYKLEPISDVIAFLAINGRNQLGIPIVFSAGNKALSLDNSYWIQNDPNVITVTGLIKGTAFAGSYGENVLISAPSMLLTASTRGNTQYEVLGNTSAAAAIVSGSLAQLLSLQPSLTVTELKNIVTHSADKLSDYHFDNNGYSPLLGYGRINPYKAIQDLLMIKKLK